MKHKTRKSKVRSMQDIAANDFGDPGAKRIIGPGKGIIKPGGMDNDSNTEFKFPESETNYEFLEDKVKEYNEGLLDSVADKYKNFKPFGSVVIVRCYHRENEKTEGGIYIPMQGLIVNEITQNGIGVRQTLPSPWQYSRKAVVVAWSDQYKDLFKFGQEVLLHVNAIQAGKQSVDSPFVLPHGFTVSEDPNNQPPKNMESEDFGYLKIDPYKLLDGFTS